MAGFTEYAGRAGSETIAQSGSYVYVWSATDNYVSRYSTSGTKVDSSGPNDFGDSYGACVGPDGRIWFTDYTNNRLWAVTSDMATLTSYSTGFAGKGVCGICSDGTDLFVACLTTDQILKVTASTGAVAATYSGTAGSGIFQICHSSGVLYFTCNSSHHIQKFTISGATFSSRVSTKTASASPYGICVGPDGNVWYVENAVDKIAKISTDLSTTHLDYATGVTGSDPRYICADSTYLWATDYGGKKLLQVATDGTVTATTVPSTRTPNDKPVFPAVGSDNRIWITFPEAGAYIYAYEASVTNTSTFTADMIVQGAGTSTFTADMVVQGTSTSTFTADMKVYYPAPGASAPAESGSPVEIVNDTLYNAFPGFCVAPNGDLLAFYTAGSSHDNADQVVKMKRSTDQGATWGTATTVSGTHTYRLKHGNPTTLSDGSIVLTYLESGNASSVQRCWSRRSTDNGVTWSTPARIPTLGTYWATDGNMGGAVTAPCVEDPANPGTLRIALHAINSGQDPTYCYVHTSKSTDYGVSWSTDATVYSYNGSTDGTEPWLLNVRKRDGSYELHCYIRSDVTAGLVRRSVSTDGGTTWGALSSVSTGAPQSTQPAVVQTPDGGIMLQTKAALGSSPSAYPHGFRYSSDFGASFGSTVTIDSAGGCVYGQWALVSPTVMGHVYALDKGPTTPYPNVSNTDADVYYQAFTVAAAPATPTTATFTADLITATRTTSTFTADMVIVTGTAVTYMQTFTADMVVNDQTRTQTFTADMVVKESGTAIFTADMVVAGSIVAVPGASTFTADLYVDTESDRASRAATWFRRRRRKMSNQIKSAFVVLPDGTTRTSTYTSPTFEADSEAGVLVSLNVTAASGTGGLTLRINSVDAASGQSFPLNSAPTAVTSTGLTAYSLYPFGGVSGNMTQSTSGYLPRKFSITVTHGDSSSYTYSVGYCLLP